MTTDSGTAGLNGATGPTQKHAVILGFRVADLGKDRAVELLSEWIADVEWPGPRLVFTANPEMLWAAQRDARLCRALNAADLLVADGVGVVVASRILGSALSGRLPGVDLLGGLLGGAAESGFHPYFLGARPSTVRCLSARLALDYPQLEPAGFHHGYFDLDDDNAVGQILQDISSSGANSLVVGMGVPRDQYFINEHRASLGQLRLALGVGGSLDVLSGRVKRAPVWVQQAGLEWLYRLATNPGRIHRQLSLPLFAFAVVGQALKRRVAPDRSSERGR